MSNSLFDLTGRVALVTGCNTGLGQAIALSLAEAGADIVGINRSPAEQTQEAIKRMGRGFVDIRHDLATLKDFDGLVAEVVQQFGQLDVLVNNAGIIRRNEALSFSVEDWDAVLHVNLKAVFFLSQAMAKHCVTQSRPGKIINVASLLSFQGGIRVPSYTASKSAVLGLTRALANEWAAQQINVNALVPGYMETNNTQQLRDDEQRNAAILARIPAGRWGVPADVGGPAVFLASDASNYMHGTSLAVDGGWLAR